MLDEWMMKKTRRKIDAGLKAKIALEATPMIERRIKEARFPTVKSLNSFPFTAIPSLNKALVLEHAHGEYIARRENVIAVGNSGTGKTQISLGLGLAACQHMGPYHGGSIELSSGERGDAEAVEVGVAQHLLDCRMS